VWCGVVASLCAGCSDIWFYEGQAALVAYIYSTAINFLVDQLAQWRDLYQEVFQNVGVRIAREARQLAEASELGPQVLDFLNAEALMLPSSNDEARAANAVQQGAILYHAAHAVDDM
jgi:hypothetical protein